MVDQSSLQFFASLTELILHSFKRLPILEVLSMVHFDICANVPRVFLYGLNALIPLDGHLPISVKLLNVQYMCFLLDLE